MFKPGNEKHLLVNVFFVVLITVVDHRPLLSQFTMFEFCLHIQQALEADVNLISTNANIFNTSDSNVIKELEMFKPDLFGALEASKQVRHGVCLVCLSLCGENGLIVKVKCVYQHVRCVVPSHCYFMFSCQPRLPACCYTRMDVLQMHMITYLNVATSLLSTRRKLPFENPIKSDDCCHGSKKQMLLKLHRNRTFALLLMQIHFFPGSKQVIRCHASLPSLSTHSHPPVPKQQCVGYKSGNENLMLATVCHVMLAGAR